MKSPSVEEQRESVELMLADLEQVGGRDLVRRLLSNFTDRLTDLLNVEPPPPWSRERAHALAGVAAMLGFSRLADACRAAMDQTVDTPPDPVRSAAFDALALASVMLNRF